MEFESDEVIQWDAEDVVEGYANPPKGFTFKGKYYEYCCFSQGNIGGAGDGGEWHMAKRADGEVVWINPLREGEWAQVFVPFNRRDEFPR